jgi:hypothetical protein
VVNISWGESHQIWGQEKKCVFAFGLDEPNMICVDHMQVFEVLELLVDF